MGTNYYLKTQPCPHCGQTLPEGRNEDYERDDKGLHIGKSSAGWTFSLRIYPYREPAIKTLEDWLPLFQKHGVVDEYGRDVALGDMVQQIASRPEWRPGVPLSRSVIDGDHCIGYGEGTYDYCVGEFS